MTASDFHRIFSRMNTFTKKPDENLNNLLRLLLCSKPFESEETKYGKSMEPHAIQKFISKNKRLHKNLNVSESGLVLMEENPFIGASPDSNVDCFCCGSGLLELKCSSSIKREKPSHENLSFLTLGENDKVTLSKTIHFFTKYNDKWLSLLKSHCGFLFTHTLEFVRNELHSIQKFGKIFFKHWNCFGTNIYHLKFYYKYFKRLLKSLLYMIKPKLSLINQIYISQKMTLPLHLFHTF